MVHKKHSKPIRLQWAETLMQLYQDGFFFMYKWESDNDDEL